MASSRDKRNVAVLAACQAIFNSGRGLTFLAATLVAANMLGDDLTFVTAPITIMLIGTAGGTLPSAILMRRLGRKWGFVITSLIGALGGLVMLLSLPGKEFIWFNFGILLYGIYSGAAQQYRFAVADAAPDDFKAKAISLVLAAGVAGAFIGPETAKLTKDLFAGAEFMGVFAALIVFTLLTGLIVLGIDIPKLSREESRTSGRPLGEILRQPAAIVAIISATFGYTVMNFIMTATPIAMKFGAHEFNDTAFVIEWHVVGMFGPGFFTGHLINRFGVLNIISASVVLFFTAIAFALSGTELWQFWVSLFLIGLGWNFAFTGGTTLLTQVHTAAERAKVQGTNDLIVFSGMAFSSLFAGIVYNFYGWTWVNLLTLPLITVILVGVVALVILNRRSPQPTAEVKPEIVQDGL